jgi:hypothetical protein
VRRPAAVAPARHPAATHASAMTVFR